MSHERPTAQFSSALDLRRPLLSLSLLCAAALLLALAPAAAEAKKSTLKATKLSVKAVSDPSGEIRVSGSVTLNAKRKSAKVTIGVTDAQNRTQKFKLTTSKRKKAARTLKYKQNIKPASSGALKLRVTVLKKNSKRVSLHYIPITDATGAPNAAAKGVSAITVESAERSATGVRIKGKVTGKAAASGRANCGVRLVLQGKKLEDRRQQIQISKLLGTGSFNINLVPKLATDTIQQVYVTCGSVTVKAL